MHLFIEELLQHPCLQLPQYFDVVFVDPPFADIGALNVLALMQDAQMLAGEGFVYVEQGRSQPQPELPNDWRLHREKTAGQVRFQLFKS